jgi:hypothetical protein
MLDASTTLVFIESLADAEHRSARRAPSVAIVGPGLVANPPGSSVEI